MNQDDSNKQITVTLGKVDDVDLLTFMLETGKNHRLNVNLEDNQSDIKAMFCDLVTILEDTGVELTLKVEDGYDNKLLEEVSMAYINDLNKELENVRAEILDKYPIET